MIPVSDVKPGTVVRFGTDDDSTVLVIANFANHIMTGNGQVPTRTLLYYGCMCATDDWEYAKLFSQQHTHRDLITVMFDIDSQC